MITARDLVTDRVAKRARRYPDLHPMPLETTGLDPRDAALARALDQAVVRHWRGLAAVLEHVLARPWSTIEPTVQAALLVGAAQLLLLDRLPDHAAVDEAAGWTRRRRPRATGLVNAVLRRTVDLRDDVVDGFDPARRDVLPLSDGRSRALQAAVLPGDAWTRLALQTSHADALVARWREQHGADAARSIALHSLVVPPVIVQGVDADDDRFVAADHGGHVFVGPPETLAEALAAHPRARVQDATSAAAVAATASLDPDVVVDACAGRGTKTRQLADLHGDARIVATDAHAGRRDELRRTFAAHPRVTVVEPAGLREWTGRAALLVLDVPCTNTGVLARRVEARHRWSPETLETLVGIQRQIVADHLPLLADSGTLLYSTCSIDPEENEAMVQWIGRWHPLGPTVARGRRPAGAPGEPATAYADGGFLACLRRSSAGHASSATMRGSPRRTER